jgi:hypothetical protein
LVVITIRSFPRPWLITGFVVITVSSFPRCEFNSRSWQCVIYPIFLINFISDLLEIGGWLDQNN